MKNNTNPIGNALYSDVIALARLVAEYDDELNINKFNLNGIISYRCKGYDLTGSSCSAWQPNKHYPKNRHFLIDRNNYEVYEIPMKSNKGLRMTGNFLCLIKCLDPCLYGVWIVCQMKHRFDRPNLGVIKEDVSFFDISELRVSKVGKDIHFHCINSGAECVRGFRTPVFDDDDNRKELGYHTTQKVLRKIYGIKNM